MYYNSTNKLNSLCIFGLGCVTFNSCVLCNVVCITVQERCTYILPYALQPM